MNSPRNNSLEPVKLPGWRWQPFFDFIIQSVSNLSLSNIIIPKDFLQKEKICNLNKKNISAKTVTWAGENTQLKKIRAACVEVNEVASVLNFVINPRHNIEMPFFGADFVSLPSGHLLALDFQPILKDDVSHMEVILDKLLPIHKYWQSFLPSGGNIPKEAQEFFSPAFLWSRLPLGEEGEKLINEVLFPAFRDYLSLYLNLLQDKKFVSGERSMELLAGQKRYLRYRTKKDPARNMLSRFYGSQWTESYINEILF